MSIKYPNRTETNFPESVDNLSRMSDLTSGDTTLVAEYYAIYNTGDLSGASAYLTAHPTLLPKIFNAAKFNKLADGIGAVQEYFIEELQTYLNNQLTYKEPYDAGSTYTKTNIVDFNGEGFMCRAESSVGVAPVSHTTTTNWAIISKQGIQGVSGTGLAPRGAWHSETQYFINDCVYASNGLWQALSDNLNSTPSAGNSNWLNILYLPVGTSASDIAVGNHGHGNITADGKIGIVADLPIFTGMDGGLVTKTAYEARQAIGALSTTVVGAANGVAPLNAVGKLGAEYIPASYSVGSTSPTNTSILWIDTTPTTGGMKYYNGTAWLHVPVAYTTS